MILILLFLLDNSPAVGENKGEVKCRTGSKARLQDTSHLTALSSTEMKERKLPISSFKRKVLKCNLKS